MNAALIFCLACNGKKLFSVITRVNWSAWDRVPVVKRRDACACTNGLNIWISWKISSRKRREILQKLAGELGLSGKVTFVLALMYAEEGERDEARQYYRKAVDRMDVIAIRLLGLEALWLNISQMSCNLQGARLIRKRRFVCFGKGHTSLGDVR
jgi:hypothetical protein